MNTYIYTLMSSERFAKDPETRPNRGQKCIFSSAYNHTLDAVQIVPGMSLKLNENSPIVHVQDVFISIVGEFRIIVINESDSKEKLFGPCLQDNPKRMRVRSLKNRTVGPDREIVIFKDQEFDVFVDITGEFDVHLPGGRTFTDTRLVDGWYIAKIFEHVS